ncbi:MAG: 2-oxoglutarate dehydrogenase component, partial [Frankiales bacterium]|nr:2-oxoglutarate dehydrogenase component [Frankiales bacterium]
MVESLQTSAQLTQVVEVDVTNVARLRDRVKADFLAREGVKLSYLPFFAKAAVDALKSHPSLNA